MILPETIVKVQMEAVVPPFRHRVKIVCVFAEIVIENQMTRKGIEIRVMLLYQPVRCLMRQIAIIQTVYVWMGKQPSRWLMD